MNELEVGFSIVWLFVAVIIIIIHDFKKRNAQVTIPVEQLKALEEIAYLTGNGGGVEPETASKNMFRAATLARNYIKNYIKN